MRLALSTIVVKSAPRRKAHPGAEVGSHLPEGARFVRLGYRRRRSEERDLCKRGEEIRRKWKEKKEGGRRSTCKKPLRRSSSSEARLEGREAGK